MASFAAHKLAAEKIVADRLVERESAKREKLLSDKQRPFRTQESLIEDAVTRDATEPFLLVRGYAVLHDHRIQTGTAVAQFLRVRGPDGQMLQTCVRLCWRRTDGRANQGRIAAAQWRARLINESWDDTLAFVVERDRAKGNTRHLLVQRDGADIAYAALIPREELAPIWRGQRDASAELIAKGPLGRRSKNHAMNGSGPAIWLKDRKQNGREIADVLRKWPGGERFGQAHHRSRTARAARR